jgi:hypothetical protein
MGEPRTATATRVSHGARSQRRRRDVRLHGARSASARAAGACARGERNRCVTTRGIADSANAGWASRRAEAFCYASRYDEGTDARRLARDGEYDDLREAEPVRVRSAATSRSKGQTASAIRVSAATTAARALAVDWREPLRLG